VEVVREPVGKTVLQDSGTNQNCAAKAIFYCPTMNSHRPRSQNTSKEQALIPEKESRRT
jgi:hypothetical protein